MSVTNDNIAYCIELYLESQGSSDLTQFTLQLDMTSGVSSISFWNYPGITQPTTLQLQSFVANVAARQTRHRFINKCTFLPSATTVQLTALGTVPTGMTCFNTTTGKITVYNGSAFV